MSTAERDFSSFGLGDNVYQLAGELLPELAERLEFDLSPEPEVGNLSKFVGVVGANKVLRENRELEVLGIDEASALAEYSGIQRRLVRSLWTPNMPLPKHVDSVIGAGGVANGQDRVTKTLVQAASQGFTADTVYLATGARRMTSGTEVTNANVQLFADKHKGEFPTESQFSEMFVEPLLKDAGYNVKPSHYTTEKGSEVADLFVADHPELWVPGKQVAAVSVANAGIHLAVQMRRSARVMAPDFDADHEEPQLYMLTDTLPIAKTAEELKSPLKFQSPFTALRQVVASARYLVIAQNQS